MLDAIKPLLDSGIINESTQTAITEAWEQQINEARETVRAELREEFARRYDHDKSVMVEALDKMVTESLTAELKEFADEKQALAEDRVKFKRHMAESAGKFNDFMVAKLSEEIKELPPLTNEQIREALTKMHHGLVIMQDRLDDHEKVLEQLITGMNNIAESMAPQKGFRTPSKKVN